MKKSIVFFREKPLLLIGLFVTFFLLAIIVLVLHFGVNTPYQDQFELITIFQKHQAGTLGFSDFFAPHNEHRLLFPTLLMFYLGLLTHWNIKFEFLVSIFFALIAVIFTVLLYKNSITSKKYFVIASIMAAILLLSPIHSENWLWGWQMQWFMNIAGAIGAIYCVSHIQKKSRAQWYWLAGAFVLAIFSAFSLGSGILLFPIIFFQLVVQQANYKKILAWVGGSLAGIGSYYYHYVSSTHESYLVTMKNLSLYKYFLLYLGNSTAIMGRVAWGFGVVMIGLFIVLCIFLILKYRSKLTVYAGLIAVGIYAILSAIITGFSRVDLGSSQAMSARYITVSQLLILSIVGLLGYALSINKDRKIELLGLITGIALFCLIIIGYVRGINMMRGDYRFKKTLQDCAITINYSPECMLAMYPSVEETKRRLEYLQTIEYGPYIRHN